MKFTRKDFVSSVITGLITGVSGWQIAEFLEVSAVRGVPTATLVFIVPILWILGVNLGYFLGRFLNFFNQFGRFAAVGFTNAAVDFGVLYLLIGLSGHATGGYYSGFKAASFVVAALHSYIWNKLWVFEAGASQQVGKEMTKFFAVTIAAAIINVLTASVIVNLVGPQLGLTVNAWAGVGAVIGSATALIFSFVGYRTIVFKK